MRNIYQPNQMEKTQVMLLLKIGRLTDELPCISLSAPSNSFGNADDVIAKTRKNNAPTIEMGLNKYKCENSCEQIKTIEPTRDCGLSE